MFVVVLRGPKYPHLSAPSSPTATAHRQELPGPSSSSASAAAAATPKTTKVPLDARYPAFDAKVHPSASSAPKGRLDDKLAWCTEGGEEGELSVHICKTLTLAISLQWDESRGLYYVQDLPPKSQLRHTQLATLHKPVGLDRSGAPVRKTTHIKYKSQSPPRLITRRPREARSRASCDAAS